MPLHTQKPKPVEAGVLDRDNKSRKRQTLRFVFHCSSTSAAHSSPDVPLKGFRRPHLAAAETRCQGPNNCRQTYASQLLTTGAVTLQWLEEQMGHTTIAMLERHYGKYISKDGPGMIPLLEHAPKL